jgi:hypothetical protein
VYARDLERQLTLFVFNLHATAYVYRQGFLLRHSHIYLRSASARGAPKLGEIILAYSHTYFAVLFAAAGALDTVATVEAKRQKLCRLLSFGHAWDFVCFIMNDSQHYFHGHDIDHYVSVILI